MRVSIIGQAAFGESAFNRLVEDGHDVVAVSAPAPAEGREDPLWAAAVGAAAVTVPTVELRDEVGANAWLRIPADVGVMAFVTEILPDELFRHPAKGTIQYHPSLLPQHRGSSAINWAIINGEPETGLTIFWPDHGIDTGPVLLQRTVAIGPDDTVGSLYFNQLFPMGVRALSDAVRMIEEGAAPRLDQDHAAATYEPPCLDTHGEIRWHESAARVYAQIRGCNPQPGAWGLLKGERVRFFDCQLTGSTEPGMPGRVLRMDEDSFDLRLNGGVLRVKRVQPESERKTSAGEWASRVGLKPGNRFR